MKIFSIFALFAVSMFISLGLPQEINAQKKRSESKKTAPLAEIEKIEVNKKEVVIICPYSDFCGKDESFSVEVQTTIRNPKNMPVIYQYTVSGGRIIGKGEKVFWDLKGVRPGDYTIMVGIDEGYGFVAETKSEKVTVKECPICDDPCICPIVSIKVKESVKAGEIVTFSTVIASDLIKEVSYNWTISRGEIIEGQGTPEIKVKTTEELIRFGIRATVKIKIESSTVEPCSACPEEFSEVTLVTK